MSHWLTGDELCRGLEWDLATGLRLARGRGRTLIIDGSALAFVCARHLWIRGLHSLDTMPLICFELGDVLNTAVAPAVVDVGVLGAGRKSRSAEEARFKTTAYVSHDNPVRLKVSAMLECLIK
jgi:hypothetical protein